MNRNVLWSGEVFEKSNNVESAQSISLDGRPQIESCPCDIQAVAIGHLAFKAKPGSLLYFQLANDKRIIEANSICN